MHNDLGVGGNSESKKTNYEAKLYFSWKMTVAWPVSMEIPIYQTSVKINKEKIIIVTF